MKKTNIFSQENLIPNHVLSASYKTLSASIPPHVHDCFEIEYIIEGSGVYEIDDAVIQIQNHMLFFMSPLSTHSFKNLEAKIINIMFPSNMCNTETLFHLFSPHHTPLHLGEENVWLEHILHEVVENTQNGRYEHALFFLQALLHKLSTFFPCDSKKYSSYTRAAIIYILENFRQNILLSDVASHIGVAPSYLSNIFAKETHINFKSYLDNIRFDYVVKQLTSSNTNVADICTLAGFTDYTNFGRRFKRKYGVSPKEYRNLYKNNSNNNVV